MFLIPCRILFEGGPHDGHFADWEYVPDGQMIVPADSRWRENEQAFDDGPACLAAIYVWRITQIVGETGSPEILLRYRFLSYHAKSAGVTARRSRVWRLSPPNIWRRLLHWFGARDPVRTESIGPPFDKSPQPRDYSELRRDA